MTMKVALILVLAAALPGVAADPVPYLQSAPMPFYPSIARQAAIQGEVSVLFAVGKEGGTTDVRAEGGHELLRRDAIENVEKWKFGWDFPCNCRVQQRAVFAYKLSGKVESQTRPVATVKWVGRRGVISVEIEADAAEVQAKNTD